MGETGNDLQQRIHQSHADPIKERVRMAAVFLMVSRSLTDLAFTLLTKGRHFSISD